MTIRQALLKIHLYIGLFAGLVILVLGISGAILALQSEGPASSPWVAPNGQPSSAAHVVEAVRRARPGQPLLGFAIPDAPDRAYGVLVRGRRVFVDPYTLSIVDEQPPQQPFYRSVYTIHATLGAGEIGRKIVGAATILSVFSVFTGLYLWWPARAVWQRALTVKWNARFRRVNHDVHNVLGFYLSIFLAILALSGVALALQDEIDSERRVRSPVPTAGAPTIPLEQALAIADRTIPGARTTWVEVPQPNRAVYRVMKKFPEDPNQTGRSRVYVHSETGGIVWRRSTREESLPARIFGWRYPLHVGSVFGTPTRILAFLASVFLAVQVVSGLLIWWKPTRGAAREATVSRKPAA